MTDHARQLTTLLLLAAAALALQRGRTRRTPPPRRPSLYVVHGRAGRRDLFELGVLDDLHNYRPSGQKGVEWPTS